MNFSRQINSWSDFELQLKKQSGYCPLQTPPTSAKSHETCNKYSLFDKSSEPTPVSSESAAPKVFDKITEPKISEESLTQEEDSIVRDPEGLQMETKGPSYLLSKIPLTKHVVEDKLILPKPSAIVSEFSNISPQVDPLEVSKFVDTEEISGDQMVFDEIPMRDTLPFDTQFSGYTKEDDSVLVVRSDSKPMYDDIGGFDDTQIKNWSKDNRLCTADNNTGDNEHQEYHGVCKERHMDNQAQCRSALATIPKFSRPPDNMESALLRTSTLRLGSDNGLGYWRHKWQIASDNAENLNSTLAINNESSLVLEKKFVALENSEPQYWLKRNEIMVNGWECFAFVEFYSTIEHQVTQIGEAKMFDKNLEGGFGFVRKENKILNGCSKMEGLLDYFEDTMISCFVFHPGGSQVDANWKMQLHIQLRP